MKDESEERRQVDHISEEERRPVSPQNLRRRQDGTITQNGEAKAVLMDVGTYDRWRDAINLMKIISHGEADITTGRTVTQAGAFERAAKAIEESSGDG